MSLYIYIILLVCTISYSIYREIVLYKKGNYRPNAFTEGKENRLINGIMIMIILPSLFLIKYDENNIIAIVAYVFGPIVAFKEIILNYLFYKKTKDKKILFNTITYSLMVIIIFILVIKDLQS